MSAGPDHRYRALRLDEGRVPSAGTRPGDAISKSDPARAYAQKEQSGSCSYLCSLHIGLGSSVDPDHVARLDEKRNLDRRPALELGRLGASRNRVAFEARIGRDDLQ